MSNLSDVAAGIKATLTHAVNGVTGLHAFDYPPDGINEFPAAVILPEPIDMEVAFGGNTFQGAFRIIYLAASADALEGWDALLDAVDPTASGVSVIRALRADHTLNGKADSSDVVRVENIGRRELWGGYYFGADFILSYIKSVG